MSDREVRVSSRAEECRRLDDDSGMMVGGGGCASGSVCARGAAVISSDAVRHQEIHALDLHSGDGRPDGDRMRAAMDAAIQPRGHRRPCRARARGLSAGRVVEAASHGGRIRRAELEGDEVIAKVVAR